MESIFVIEFIDDNDSRQSIPIYGSSVEEIREKLTMAIDHYAAYAIHRSVLEARYNDLHKFTLATTPEERRIRHEQKRQIKDKMTEDGVLGYVKGDYYEIIYEDGSVISGLNDLVNIDKHVSYDWHLYSPYTIVPIEEWIKKHAIGLPK